jgi:RHS repeat-associated protein
MDRLGSDVRGTQYFPYGAEATGTASDRDKFATYYRDTATGLDYADQRYYSSTIGRFLSPDPYVASGGPANPASWNRYAYVGGDPINSRDPSGLYAEEGEDGPFSITVRSGPIYVDYSWANFMAAGWDMDARSARVRITNYDFDVGGAKRPTATSIAERYAKRVRDGFTDDCNALANFADALAANTSDVQDFISGFAVLTPEQIGTVLTGVHGSDKPIYFGTGSGPTGYSQQYKDSNVPSQDQGHHFAAFFQLGSIVGATVGQGLAVIFEALEGTPNNYGDIALGGKASELGARVNGGFLLPGDLGAEIRKTICAK